MGPNILVTGSTDGIGRATVMDLAKQGAGAIIHGRSRSKAWIVQREGQDVSDGEQPDIFIANLSDTDQVRVMATEISSVYPRLGGLVNNAGRTTRPGPWQMVAWR